MTNETPQSDKGRLSADEREALKRTFIAYMDENPAPASMPIPSLSPYFPRMVRIPALAFASFLFVVTGSAYAAERSLPNDFLYPVKTEVIEPLFIEAPAFSKHAKARANTTLITRRLIEARELINDDELSPELASSLTAEVEVRTEAVESYVNEAVASGDLTNAFEIGTEAETTLDAHGEVLATLAEDRGIVGSAIEELVQDVEIEADEATGTTDRLETVAISKSGPELEAFLTSTYESIEDTLGRTRESQASIPEDSTIELTQTAELLIIEADTQHAESTSAFAAGDIPEAIEKARDSLRAAKRAQIFIESLEDTASN